jgi:hypothetical protein
VKWSVVLVAEAAAGVVTVTSTTPAACAGELTVILVAETTLTLDAAAVPKWTAVAPVNPVPVIVTAVPPAVVPVLGAMDVTAGGVM